MSNQRIERRDFIKSILGGLSMVTLDWTAFPIGAADKDENQFDAVIIGSGLGGLSCAAAFARQGFKPLVLEQHNKPGGYATTFKRPGGFVFDVSLHSTAVEERDGIHNLIPGFPEITEVEFVPHPHLYRAIFPEHDIRVPQKDLNGYIKILTDYFPDEQQGILGLFEDMKGIARDINKLSSAKELDMSRFAVDFPHLFNCYSKTWGEVVDARIKNTKLKAIISALWGYYGLPPSKLASFYYAIATIGYLENGGYYPKGKSQKLSNALGLNQDLVSEVGITDTEIFYTTGYDAEAEFQAAVKAEVGGGFGLTLYDNLYQGYSPEGKNTLNIIAGQGYDHWQQYEADYFQGKKAAYRKEKERMADLLIEQVEATLLPGLVDAIEIKEIGTPLTNVRYTGNYRGAIYGWDQTLDNSGPSRLPHKTPIQNLYLAGAWTFPGGGYTAVIGSGLQCFGEIIRDW